MVCVIYAGSLFLVKNEKKKKKKKQQEAVSNLEITVTKQKQLVKSKIPSIS